MENQILKHALLSFCQTHGDVINHKQYFIISSSKTTYIKKNISNIENEKKPVILFLDGQWTWMEG